MLNALLKAYRRLVSDLSYSQLDEPKAPSKAQSVSDDINDIEQPLDNSCGQINFYFREDGEFAVASDFKRTDESVYEITGMLLHMINSGNLAEYFVKSLKLWAEGDIDKEKFAKEVIHEWKKLFYEENGDDLDNIKRQHNLAVDPSDVFGLKRMK